MVNGAYISHHGIKGQRWGVRRFQNEDGSLTPAGERRYLVDSARNTFNQEKKLHKASNREWQKATAGGFIVYDPRLYKKGSETQKRYRKALTKAVSSEVRFQRAKNDYRYAKEDAKNMAIMEKLSKETKTSKRRQKYEQQYIAKGMTEDEARIAAYKRDRTEKIMMIAGGVAIASIAAYSVYKYRDYTFDKILSKGTELGRIEPRNTLGVKDGMFAYLKKNTMDVNRYKGFYANQLRSGMYFHTPRGSDIYEKSMKVGSDLKIASPKNAAKIFQDVLDRQVSNGNNKMLISIRNNIASMVSDKEFDRFVKNGKITPKIYDAINRNFADKTVRSDFSEAIQALKEAGYAGIADRNDIKYSGFGSKLPIIILDSGKVAVESVKNVPYSEINKRAAVAGADIYMRALGKATLPYAAIYAGAKGAKKITTSKRNDRIVRTYREKHPETKMSYQEIVRAYEQGRLH